MSNSGDRKTYDREQRQEFYTDTNGNTHTHVTRTTETADHPVAEQPESYRDGYIQGRTSERRYQEDVLTERDNDNAARGLLVGIILTSLAAVAAGAIWFLTQRNETPTQVIPPVIVSPDASPAASPSPELEQPPARETIIEKTREVLVPIPQPQSSPSPQQSAPSQPAAEPTPNTQIPTQPQNQSSSTENSATQSDASTPTLDTNSEPNSTPTAPDPANQIDVIPEGNSATGTDNTSDSAQ